MTADERIAQVMKELVILVSALYVGVVNAGSLDNPTNVFEHFPNVNVDAHMLKPKFQG